MRRSRSLGAAVISLVYEHFPEIQTKMINYKKKQFKYKTEPEDFSNHSLAGQ